MELRHLRYFVAVAEEENVSRAAVKLRVSQPGISRQIHALEEEIGFALFERSAKSVRLTAAGKIFLAESRDILRNVESAVAKARAGIVTQGELNVGYVPSVTVEILPRALQSFVGRFPGVRVKLHDLSVEEMLPLLLQQKLDIVLTVAPRKLPRELGLCDLEKYAICVAVSPKHPLAKSKSVTLGQVAGEPVIGYSRKEYPDYHKYLEGMFATIGRTPRIGSEHDGVTSVIAAVEAGNGFALLPSCVSGMAGPRIKLVSLRPALPPIPVAALWRKVTETDLVRAFVAAATGDGTGK
ncbi:MAG TPA: LysR substrate-binding domain-containing protein [Candidatus Limnocylindria bacterium]|nr:LysR substrate-binding domain-containing protein [Candidatus Limnocylindria bacterium]